MTAIYADYKEALYCSHIDLLQKKYIFDQTVGDAHCKRRIFAIDPIQIWWIDFMDFPRRENRQSIPIGGSGIHVMKKRLADWYNFYSHILNFRIQMRPTIGERILEKFKPLSAACSIIFLFGKNEDMSQRFPNDVETIKILHMAHSLGRHFCHVLAFFESLLRNQFFPTEAGAKLLLR